MRPIIKDYVNKRAGAHDDLFYGKVRVYSVEDYIDQHTDKFYCEAFILSDGRVVNAHPSHTTMLYELTTQYDKSITSSDQLHVSYYMEHMFHITGAVEVRYESQRSLNPLTPEQIQTIEMLSERQIISTNYSMIPSRDRFYEVVLPSIEKDYLNKDCT